MPCPRLAQKPSVDLSTLQERFPVHMRWGRTRTFVLLLFLLVPLPGVSRNEKPRARAGEVVCGSHPEYQANQLAKARYYESRNRQRLLAAPAARAVQADAGDVAVIEDDGSIIQRENLFDLAAKSFRFEPISPGSYRVLATNTNFDPSDGTPVRLSDDDSQSINLGFSFTFFGAVYNSVFLNSDGNLSFGAGDSESNDRDLARLASGPPRIGPFFTDLDPSAGGAVSTRNDSDGILFIWSNVPNWGTSNSNNFSVKFFHNGGIEFVYGSKMDAAAELDGSIAVVGISPGSSQSGVAAVNYSNDLPTTGLTGTIAEVFARSSDISITALARKFFETHPDDFDHLIVFLAFDQDLGGAFAFEVNVRNEIEGIGPVSGKPQPVFDESRDFGSEGRLRSFVMMGPLDGPGRYPDDPNLQFLGTNNTVSILGQESGHRWLAFLSFQDGNTASKELLGRDEAHWSFFFDSDSSVMEGNDIEDRGGGAFRTVGATSTYNRLDQYAIGLVGKEDVPDMFFVQNPTGTLKTPGSNPEVGIGFNGTRRNISIDDIIAANGPRKPAVFESPKVFRQAFILLTRQGQQATAAQIAKVQRVRDAWVAFFNEQTGGRGWVVTNLQNTPGTTPTKIYFPYFRGDSRRFTGFAVANWGNTPADVLFKAFDNSGNPTAAPSTIMNPRMITIPAGRQIALLGEEIHNLTLADVRDGWIEARSTSSQVSAFFLEGDVGLTALDGAVAGNQTSKELYFTQASLGNPVFLGNSYKNLIDVVNPNEESATLQFQLVNEFGQVQATAGRTLNPHGRLAQDLSDLFPGIATPRRMGYVKFASNVGVVGYQSLDGVNAIYALPAQHSSAATKLYSAQFASGGIGGVQLFTDLNLINTGSSSRSLQILLIGNDGTAISGITNPVSFNLAAGEQMRSRGDALFGLPNAAFASGLTVGSLVITADGPGMIGDVTFGDAVNERFVASLPLDGTPLSNFVFSQVVEGAVGGGKPYFTGIAMYNPNASDVTVTIDVFSADGVKTGSATLPLRSGNRISKVLPELVPEVTNQIRGYIRISASGPIISFELFGDQALELLSAVPPQPITP